MGLLRSRQPAPPRPVITDPFAAVPVKPDNVELRRDSQGMIHLRRRQELTGLRKKIADRLGYDYTQKLELDEYGTLYYSLVDGTNTLHIIVQQMIAKSQKSQKEVQDGVILFTKKLMTMNMLVLKVTPP